MGSHGGRGGCGTHVNNVGHSGTKEQLLCHYCGVPGHIKSNCYKVHGYPNNKVANVSVSSALENQ